MKVKNIIILGIGATGGFVGGSVFIIYKMLNSERMRKALVDIVADKTEKLLFGKETYRPINKSRVSYYNYRNINKKETKQPHYYKEVIFDTYGDANAVLDDMRNIINQYGYISVSDYYDLCSVPNNDYETTKYGWTTINDGMIVRYRDGYKIKLPKTIKLK